MVEGAAFDGNATVEEAARAVYEGFPVSLLPGRMIHSVVSPREVEAVVMFEAEQYKDNGILMNRDGVQVVVCERRNDRWFPAWGPDTYFTVSSPPRGSNLMMYRTGLAIPGATAVLVRYRSREHTVEVSESGHFIFVAWKDPWRQRFEDSPVIVGYLMA